MDVTQGKLIIGMGLDIDDDNLRFDVMIYNTYFWWKCKLKTIPKCT